MNGFASPEEAARFGVPGEYVRVVGVVVRGDEAIVAQVLNADGYPAAYEIETSQPWRKGGRWQPGDGGNGNVAHIETADDQYTVVWWGEGRPGSSAVRLRLAKREQTVGVEDGFFFAVFDDVPAADWRPYERFVDGPRDELPTVLEWISDRPDE